MISSSGQNLTWIDIQFIGNFSTLSLVMKYLLNSPI